MDEALYIYHHFYPSLFAYFLACNSYISCHMIVLSLTSKTDKQHLTLIKYYYHSLVTFLWQMLCVTKNFKLYSKYPMHSMVNMFLDCPYHSQDIMQYIWRQTSLSAQYAIFEYHNKLKTLQYPRIYNNFCSMEAIQINQRSFATPSALPTALALTSHSAFLRFI